MFNSLCSLSLPFPVSPFYFLSFSVHSPFSLPSLMLLRLDLLVMLMLIVLILSIIMIMMLDNIIVCSSVAWYWFSVGLITCDWPRCEPSTPSGFLGLLPPFSSDIYKISKMELAKSQNQQHLFPELNFIFFLSQENLFIFFLFWTQL